MNKKQFACAALVAAGSVLVSGAASAGEALLSSVGSWKVIINRNADNSFNRCILESTQGGQMLRVASDGNMSLNLSLSVPASGLRNGADATIGFNGNQPEHFKFSANKERAWVGIPFEMGQMLERARSIEVDINGRELKWKLSGTSEAMGRLADCVNKNKK